MTDRPIFDVRATRTRDEIAALLRQAEGPVLQIGSRAQRLDTVTLTWRKRFAGTPFVGLDLAPGDNVDVVADITEDADALRRKLGLAPFGFILCLHVLEHVRQPWRAADNIVALLKPGGLVFIQVPWVQAFHAYPDDYWRISLSGLEQLFPGLDFIDMFYTGGAGDRAYRLFRDGRHDLSLASRRMEPRMFQVLLSEADSRALVAGQRPPRLYLSEGYLPAMVVNAVGRKR